MRKFYFVLPLALMLSLIFCAATIFAQKKDNYELRVDSVLKSFDKQGTFVLKGKVRNFKGSYIDLGVSGYVKDNFTTLIINKDGGFEQTFPIVKTQQLLLALGSTPIKLTISGKDTLEMHWDNNDVNVTFSVQNTNPYRNAILQTEVMVNKKTLVAYFNLLNNELNDKKNPSSPAQKFEKINALYNEGIKIILAEEKKYPELVKKNRAPFTNLIADQYFTYTHLLYDKKLLAETPLKITDKNLLSALKDSIVNQGKTYFYLRYPILDTTKTGYKIASEPYFAAIPSYRRFVYDYLRFSKNETFTTSTAFVFNPGQLGQQNNTLLYYNKAKQHFSSALLRDWFMTKILEDGFGHSPFDEVKSVYNLYLEECKTPFFKAAMIQNFEAVKGLKPGLIAPNFTLKDLNGKEVSLTTLKGKVVYIDFWGVGCGPCIYEFENHTAKLQAKYKDKAVVFLNICVDSNEKEWKNGIKKYKVTGTI